MRENEPSQTPEVRPLPAMTVHCPHCSTGYLMPDHLVGARGARVRCPDCQGAFVVLPGSRWADAGGALEGSRSEGFESGGGGNVAAAVMEAETASTDRPPLSQTHLPDPPLAEEPAAVAAAVLDSLLATLGEALFDARLRGKVLSEHGPAIMTAYAEYRRRAGAGAAAEPFRAVLKDRCGVDLIARARA